MFGLPHGGGERGEFLQHGFDLLFVVGRLRKTCGHHQHAVGRDRGLRVVTLLKATARHLHDARVFVGEVDLIDRTRAFFRRGRRLATGLFARRALVGFTLGELVFLFGFFLLVAHCCTSQDLGLDRFHGSEPVLPAFDLIGQVHAIGQVALIDLLGLGKQVCNLGFALGFYLLDVPVRARAVPRGVGVDLGAVKTNRPQLEQFHLTGQFENLQKNAAELIEKGTAEGCQRVMVRVAAGGQVAQDHGVVSGALDPAAGKHARGIAINKQPQQGFRMVGRATTTSVGIAQNRQVNPLRLNHKTRQVIFR